MFLDSLNGATPAALQQLRSLAIGQLRAQLDRRLLGLRYAADQDQGGTGLLGFMFNNKFKPDALNFLTNNNMFIYGSNTDGVVDCFLEYIWKYDQFKIIPPPSGKPHPYQLKAVNVPAVPWDLVPNRTAGSTFADIVGTELTGADVMISTQFTGCAFCFKEVGGRLFAAHIMPDNGNAGQIPGSGIELANQLAGQRAPTVTGGDFSNAPGVGTFKVYGRGYSNIASRPAGYVYTGPPSAMTVIGVRRGAGWQIFSQEVSATKQLSVYQIL